MESVALLTVLALQERLPSPTLELMLIQELVIDQASVRKGA